MRAPFATYQVIKSSRRFFQIRNLTQFSPRILRDSMDKLQKILDSLKLNTKNHVQFSGESPLLSSDSQGASDPKGSDVSKLGVLNLVSLVYANQLWGTCHKYLVAGKVFKFVKYLKYIIKQTQCYLYINITSHLLAFLV